LDSGFSTAFLEAEFSALIGAATFLVDAFFAVPFSNLEGAAFFDLGVALLVLETALLDFFSSLGVKSSITSSTHSWLSPSVFSQSCRLAPAIEEIPTISRYFSAAIDLIL
jgi:hypothetical protein